MMGTSLTDRRSLGLASVTVLLGLELAAVGVIYKHLIDFQCLAEWPFNMCRGASGLMVSVYTMIGALALAGLLLPAAARSLVAEARLRRTPLMVNLAGLAVMFLPLPLMQPGSGAGAVPIVLALWGLGIALGGLGAALMLAPLPRWQALWRAHGPILAFAALAGALAPIVAVQIRPAWRELEPLVAATFNTVAWLIEALGYDVEIHAEHRVIGAGDFFIDIAPVCSGIEGIALVTVFVTIYLALFRRELRFPRALVLYPLGILASACLNVVRIVVLLAIGLEGSPEVAVGGFHSHAGWLMFTLLSVGLVLAANTMPWLRAERGPVALPARPAFLADLVVAQILPFLVFMASMLLAQTVSNLPGLLYPWRAVAMAAVLACFLPLYRAMPWRLDPLALGCGVVVGALWLVTAPAANPESELALALAGLGPLALAIWIAARMIGTTVFVPVIEELFFRGYLLDRIRGRGGLWLDMAAIAITSALFAALHDRWLAAGLAGVAFGLIRLRTGRVTDAILAHAVANGIIAVAALLRSDWALI